MSAVAKLELVRHWVEQVWAVQNSIARLQQMGVTLPPAAWHGIWGGDILNFG